MATKKKLLEAAAGSAGGGDAFSVESLEFQGTGGLPITSFHSTNEVQDVDFSSDGTKIYVCGRDISGLQRRVVHQYDLSTAWEVSTRSLEPSATLDMTAEDMGSNFGIHLKPDGTELYVLDGANLKVQQYSLSTAWDLSTESHTGTLTLPASGQNGYVQQPRDITFNDNEQSSGSNNAGQYVFILNQGGTDSVIAFQMSTYWDITTASWYETSTVDTGSGNGLAWNSDGSKLYISDFTNDRVKQFNRSSNYTIDSSGMSSNATLSIDLQTNSPSGIFYKNSSTFFVCDATYHALYECKFGTADNISGGGIKYPTSDYYTSYSDLGSTTGELRDIAFKTDGTKFYTLDEGSDKIGQYTLTTAWDIDTASSFTSFSVATQSTGPFAIAFSPDGTKLTMFDGSGKAFYDYDLSTAWDVTTASAFASSSATSMQDNVSIAGRSFTFNDDGTELFMSTDYGGIYQFDLTTAYRGSSITIPTDLPLRHVGDEETAPCGIFFKPDGSSFFLVGTGSDYVQEYSNTTAWDISDGSYQSSNAKNLGTFTTNPVDIEFKPDGTKMYMVDRTNDNIREFELSTAWDVTTATSLNTVSTSGGTPEGMCYKPDGYSFFVIDSASDEVHEYIGNTTAWSLGNVQKSTSNYYDFSEWASSANDVFIKSDGTELYILGSTLDKVTQHTLSTAWDLTTASYTATFRPPNISAGESLFFKSDGTKMYIACRSEDKVFEYKLSTAWDITTAYFDAGSGKFLGVADDVVAYSDDGSIVRGLEFDSTGNNLYVMNDHFLSRYSVTTPFTLIGATLEEFVAADVRPRAFTIKPDFSRAYIADRVNMDIYEFTNTAV
jgi:sugar lactone lactonase YvrE